MAEYVGAMDQGTTSTRFIVFDKDGDIDNVDGAGECADNGRYRRRSLTSCEDAELRLTLSYAVAYDRPSVNPRRREP